MYVCISHNVVLLVVYWLFIRSSVCLTLTFPTRHVSVRPQKEKRITREICGAQTTHPSCYFGNDEVKDRTDGPSIPLSLNLISNASASGQWPVGSLVSMDNAPLLDHIEREPDREIHLNKCRILAAAHTAARTAAHCCSQASG